MRKIVAGLVFLAILLPHFSWAAWTYTQNFDSLSTAALNGQDSWAEDGGTSQFQVQTTTVIQGTKTVGNVSSLDNNVHRDITGITDGCMSLQVRKGTLTSLDFDIRLETSSTILAFLRMSTASGNLTIFTAATTDTTLGTYAINTNYTLDVQVDLSTDQQRWRLNGGTWTAWKAFYLSATATNVDRIEFSKQGSATAGAYFDDFKSCDVVSGVSHIRIDSGSMVIDSGSARIE